jgi:prepilin-type N-terminal cleavage/methylation domain-containing protein
MKNKISASPGFTIVELLVVIVVIGILAAITIVSYNGISNKASVASIMSDLSNSSTKLKLFYTDNGAYPLTNNCSIAESNTNVCLKASSGNSIQLSPSDISNPQSYSITDQRGSLIYQASATTTPSQVSDLSFGLVTYLDAGNVASYPGSGTTWTDMSGKNVTGTLLSGVLYDGTNGGSLVFNGVDRYAQLNYSNIPNLYSFSASAWIYISGDGSMTANGVMNGKAFRTFLYDSNNFISTQINGVTPYNDDTTVLVSRNQWANIAFSYDGINRKYYLNGVLAATTPSTGVPLNTGDAEVGSIQGSAYDFNGKISEVRYYNRALYPSEFLQIFNNIKSRYGL